MPTPDATHPAARSAADHFEHWLLQRSVATRDRLTPAAARPYRYIWGAWQRWLSTPHAHLPACSWQEASALHVWSFLQQGISPSSGRKEASTAISEITRRRYWRILDALYEHARAQQLIAENPARNLDEPRPEPERPEGQVFNEIQFRAVRNAIPEPKSNWDMRDRAILLLLIDAALTTGEVCSMEMHQVHDHLKRVALRLDGRRAAQERTLELLDDASKAVKDWMAHRRDMQVAQQHQSKVFISQRGVPMAPRAVFHLVSTTVNRGFTSEHLDLPNHIGAQVLRNTRLVMWMKAGVDPDEVVRRAGYKDVRSFRGLVRHLNEPLG